MNKDSQMALDLDDQYIKAWVSLAESLVELGKHDYNVDRIEKGIQRLRKSLQLCFKHN